MTLGYVETLGTQNRQGETYLSRHWHQGLVQVPQVGVPGRGGREGPTSPCTDFFGLSESIF